MKRFKGIDVNLNMKMDDFIIKRLSSKDIPIIQTIFEKCRDYLLLVNGYEVNKNTGRDEYISMPPGKTEDDKIVFGIFNQKNEIISYIDILKNYPEEESYWIGLFLVDPLLRSKGVGERIILEFIRNAKTIGVSYIKLGVVEENEKAYKFWKKIGFETYDITAPREFGNKTHRVNKMELKL